MNRVSGYIIQNTKDLKYILLAVGIGFILYGIFHDPSWLKAIGDCMARDRICARSGVLNSPSIVLTSLGCLLTLFALRGGPVLFVKNNRFEIFLEFAIAILIILFFISCQVRFFDNDEYEHLHNAWLMTEGTIPYFSWDKAHTPLLEWTIISFMAITGENTIIVQVMRLFIFFISCGSLLLVYKISKELYQSRPHALVAVLLVLSNCVWILKSPEIRPDNLMLFFALLSFWFLIRYYKDFQIKYLLLFLLCAVLSMLGKQNAAVFYLPVGLVFAYDFLVHRKKATLRTLIIGTMVIGLLFALEPVRHFLMINIDRHLVPSRLRFSPNGPLSTALSFNPAAFLLFLFQLFSSYKLPDSYKPFRYYLLAVPIVCFIFLYLMNRPFHQEMIVMIVFMSIVGANMLMNIIRKLEWTLMYVIAGVIMLPAFLYMSNTGLFQTWTKDLQTTKTILRISRRDDLVFDSYGKPIFRHHPMEPHYLMYNPRAFNRLKELKKSGVKYLIVDQYTKGLPKETLNWFRQHFIRSRENSNIFIRRKEQRAHSSPRS